MKVEINGNILEFKKGDITTVQADAIVNAANGTLLGGGGVDGAIHRAAGKELLQECKRIREEQLHGEELPSGDAVMTKGYNLPADYVIHTVGPVWEGGEHKEAERDFLTAIKTLLLSCGNTSYNISLSHPYLPGLTGSQLN